MKGTERLLIEHAREVAELLQRSGRVPVLMLEEDLTIAYYNEALGRLIGGPESSYGKSVLAILRKESHVLFPFDKGVEQAPTRLNFISSRFTSVELNCNAVRLSDGKYLLICGNPVQTNSQVLNQMTIISNEMTNMTRGLSKKNRELEEANSKIRMLSGIIPICMHCKQIRTDQGYWVQLERFMMEHSDAEFSHGICEKCTVEHYPELEVKAGGEAKRKGDNDVS